MKLKTLKYFPFTLNFTNQFHTAQAKFKTRKTYILYLQNEAGRMIYGEVGPLPDFGSESFEDVEVELNKFSDSFIFEFDDNQNDLFNYIDSLNTLPSVKYGLEFIFLQNLLLHDEKLRSKILKSTDINVNAIINISDLDSSKKKLENLVNQNYRVVKIKTEDENFEELVDFISWAETEIEAKLKFRIDPNGSWNKKDTLKRAERLSNHKIEYIEQPVKNIDDLLSIAEFSPVPIAADESVRNLESAKHIIENSKIKFLVIKPMLFGGLSNILKLKELLNKKDVNIIVSSSLESNVGRRHLALITANIENNFAHGLDTSNLFNNQITHDVFPVSNGKINFSTSKFLSPMDIKYS